MTNGEQPPPELGGIHHLTAVTADASGNHRFYTGVLGMRLVKRTVNQDDVSAYHLFYADGEGSAGSDLTFFDWPVGRERRGTNSIVRTALRVAGEASLAWWVQRLTSKGVAHGDIAERDGRLVLDFDDPEGQRLSLVDDGSTGVASPWARSPVPAEHQIRGLGPITMSVPELAPTDAVLTEVMRMRRVRRYMDAAGAMAATRRWRSMRWDRAGRPRSCTSRSSPMPRVPAPVRAVSTMSRSAPPMRQRTAPGPGSCGDLAWPIAVRSTATTSRASISASRTACCSRSPPTGPASPSTSRRRPSASGWRCRRSSSRSAAGSRLG